MVTSGFAPPGPELSRTEVANGGNMSWKPSVDNPAEYPSRILRQAFLAALLITPLISAQVLAVEPDSASDSSYSLSEIVVTAQRREQAVLEVPASISVIPEEAMERQNIHSFADYAVRVPNLTYDQVGVIGYRGDIDATIRGVKGLTNYYLDDTPLPITDVRLFDIDRVEVLRGPQGTLYGDAAMGGTIKVITNKPTMDRFSGAAAVSYGWTKEGADSTSTDIYVNIPLGERVAARVTAYYDQIGGYIDNIPPSEGLGDQSGGGIVPFQVNVQKDVNGADRRGVRADLRVKPVDSLTVDLSAWIQDVSDGARSFYDATTPLQTAYRGTMFDKQKLDLYNATLNWSQGPFNILSSTTSYKRDTINSEDITVYLAEGLFGFSPSVFTNPQQLNNSRPDNGFTHETRFSFNGKVGAMPLFALGGVFYQRVRTDYNQYWYDLQSITDINNALDPTGTKGIDFGANFDALGIPRGLWAIQQQPNRESQLAFFGEVSITPLPGLELTAGLRRFSFDISQTRTTNGFLFSGFETQSGKTSDSGVIPRFNIKQHVTDDVIVYASASKGFNIGSALGSALPTSCQSALDALGLSDGPVKPETLWSYELGTKGRFFGGRMVLDAAAFYIDWKDIQESVRFADNSCPETLLGNFGSAKIKGAELSFAISPIDRLDIAGSAAYSNGDRSQPPLGLDASEAVGNDVLTTSLQTQYRFPINAALQGYVGGDHQYIQEAKDSAPGTPHYHLTNLRVGIIGTNNWELALVGRNVFNDQPILVTYPPGAIGNLVQQNATLRPRSINLEARVRF